MDSSSRRSLAAALAPAATPPMINVFIESFFLLENNFRESLSSAALRAARNAHCVPSVFRPLRRTGRTEGGERQSKNSTHSLFFPAGFCSGSERSVKGNRSVPGKRRKVTGRQGEKSALPTARRGKWGEGGGAFSSLNVAGSLRRLLSATAAKIDVR